MVRSRRNVLALALVATLGVGCAGARHGGSQGELSALERSELLRIGDEAVRAVLAGDFDRPVGYARRDLRDDAAAMGGMRGELEAYLFGDVRRVLSTAQPLDIRIRGVATDSAGMRWAELVFFNGGTVTEAMLRKPDFLCHHDLKDAVAWTFRRMTGQWESMGYPFDAFTDIHCPPD